MSSAPDWLPSMVSVNGTWEEILARLYQVFDKDFRQGRPAFEGRPVWWDRRILPGDIYEEGFWHLITKGDRVRQDRVLDSPRARRIPWCAPTITRPQDNAVKVWDYEKGSGRIRTYVWLEDLDYVVILEKRTKRTRRGPLDVAFLVTAFHIDGKSSRQWFKRSYEQRRP